MMKLQYTYVAVALLIVVVLLTGCSSSLENELQQTETRNILKVGFTGPLTGELTSWGQNSLAGAKLAVTEVNAKGGVLGREVQLVAEDDVCDATRGVNGVNKLIFVDRVEGMVGPICSGVGSAILPIAQEQSVPTVITAASNPALAKIGNYVFRVYPSDSFQGKESARFITNHLQKTRAAVLYINNDWGKGLRDVFTAEFPTMNGEVVYEAAIQPDSLDVRTQLLQIEESGADVIYAPLYVDSGIAVTKQLKEQGSALPVVGGDALDADDFVKSPYATGTIYPVPKVRAPERFRQLINSLPGFGDLQVTLAAPLGYDATKILLSAMQEAGSTAPSAVRQVLDQGSFTGITKTAITFDQNGDLQDPVYEFKVVREGRSVPLVG